MTQSAFKPSILLTALSLLATWPNVLTAGPPARLEFSVTGADNLPLPCRIHLWDQQGTAQRAEGQPFWHDHFVCSGRVIVSLAPGAYDFAIERGPEYRRHTGSIDILAGENRQLDLKLERITNLRAGGWYSGDLHVHRPVAEIEPLMQAEDLDFAPVITWWNSRNPWNEQAIPEQVVRRFDGHRIYAVMAGEDEREGGALLYFGLPSPLDIETDDREFPSPMQFVETARRRRSTVWIDIEKPFWWDVPVWLASGQMNSIGIANNHMCRSQMYANEAWGKSRDSQRLPEPRGNGFWSQEIYYHMLNCGLRLPPSAGSASGVLPNPVGYNRVYVQLDAPFEYESWFRGLQQGRCFVTNGPLLKATVNGQHPGAVFELAHAERRSLRVNVELTTQDPVSQIELIKNGQVAHVVKCSAAQQQRHSFELTVDQPCWLLVRAITDVPETFRFASTAPWYVEAQGAAPYISRRSVQFFLDWVDERIERVKSNLDDPSRLASVLVWHERARQFWAERLAMAGDE
jgi:hypothetical protein